MPTTYDPTTSRGLVRLLLNDVGDPWVFQDAEIDAFLTLEGASVKKAAAQAIETNATNMVLAMRVLRSQDVATDGAKVADAMRAQAKSLREQADTSDDDGAFFDVVALDESAAVNQSTGVSVDYFW